MKKSEFTYLFKNDDKFYVAQSCTKKMFELNESVYRALENNDFDVLKSEDVYNLFIDSKILSYSSK